VKIFWPHRSNAKGFSIGNIALKYREKISNVSSDKASKELLDDRNLKSMKQNSQQVTTSHLAIKRSHWANRDFSEYRDAA
tara:strand:+ start:223 stop:462 length:240 start_codon:yes stop_codon:yes gene_type:complete